jgi:thiamine-phosphate pyrophosphorylase
MELIIISNPVCFIGEAVIINRLFEAGLKIFHLRKDNLGKVETEAYLKDINVIYHDRIALHRHHELVVDYNLKRVHLPEKVRKAGHCQFSSGSILKSTSIHRLGELTTLTGYDYTFFSPVFNSISKPGYNGIVKDDFEVEKGSAQTRVIALGGIDHTNIQKTKDMKFDGVAILGNIWNDPSQALENFHNIKEQCK